MPANLTREGDQIFGLAFKEIAAVTAAYTCLAEDSGKIFTTRGATQAVTYTLPSPLTTPIGTEYTFYSISAYGMVVSCSGKLNVVNNASASTITCTTASNIIGANVYVVNDGTKWLTFMGTGPTIAAYAIA